jgi:hypothetical protein
MEKKDEHVVDYAAIQKKFSLPDFESLDKLFEVSTLEADKFFLRAARRHIVEKFHFYIEILEELIHPNGTVSAYHECKFFDDEQKKSIYDLYSRLMVYVRKSNLLDLKLDDKQDAQFINEAYKAWPQLSADLVKVIEKIKDCWSEEEAVDSSAESYMG